MSGPPTRHIGRLRSAAWLLQRHDSHPSGRCEADSPSSSSAH
jgi:hypothetical protein